MHCTTESLLNNLSTLVQEEFRVVSYKWLAREYQIPSNHAKQVLFQYVQQQGSKVKAIYLVSGYLKVNPSCHVTRLVDASQLQACCEELASQTSVHIHSVLPNEPHPVTDPARLCAEDTLQARQLYQSALKQGPSSSADVFAKNSCSSVKFIVDIATPPRKQQQQQGPQLQHQEDRTQPQQPSGSGRTTASPVVAAGRTAAVGGQGDGSATKRQKVSTMADSVAAAADAGGQVLEDQEMQEADIADAAVAVAPAAVVQDAEGVQQSRAAPSAGPAAGGSGRGSAAGARAGSGRQPAGGRAGSRAAKGKGGGQKNITSFFGKQ